MAKYLTLDLDLVEHAVSFTAYLRDRNFSVGIEPSDIEYPGTPTLRGSRGVARYFVEVNSSCPMQVLKDWASYGKCRQKESYVALLVPVATTISGLHLAQIRQLGIGVYQSGPEGITELIRERDLSVVVSLPSLSGIDRPIKRQMTDAYAKINRGDWIDGFKDACQLLEDGARERLRRRTANGHAALVGKQVTLARISKMTLGSLANTYERLVQPTSEDIQLTKALSAVNPQRIGAVHNSNDQCVVRRIKTKFSSLMWVVVNGLKQL